MRCLIGSHAQNPGIGSSPESRSESSYGSTQIVQFFTSGSWLLAPGSGLWLFTSAPGFDSSLFSFSVKEPDEEIQKIGLGLQSRLWPTLIKKLKNWTIFVDLLHDKKSLLIFWFWHPNFWIGPLDVTGLEINGSLFLVFFWWSTYALGFDCPPWAPEIDCLLFLVFFWWSTWTLGFDSSCWLRALIAHLGLRFRA